MSQERKANRAQSTLNSGIDSSVTSLDVVSATDFPTTGQFRILIETEILLVTAVSGNTFTVTRAIEGPEAAAAHDAGKEVTLVETKEGQIRHLRDWTNPLFEVGRPMQLLDASGNTLTASSFTDVNMTNAIKTDQTGGAILLEHATQGAVNDYAIITRTYAAPRTLRVGFIPNLLNETGDFPSAGPILRESATGELYAFRLLARDVGTTIDVVKLASPTASSTGFLAYLDWTHPTVAWMEIEDNNTNLIFKLSADGVNFITIGQEARTTFMAGGPDEIGFAINNFGNGAIVAHATLVSWAEF